MGKMFIPVFRTVYRKREAKICLIFSAFPVLLVLTSLLPTNFMQLSGEAGTMSCMDFFEAVVSVQFQLTLPSIAFMYLVASSVCDEIKTGRLRLYKDIPRRRVFLYKSMTLLAWYGIYFVCTFLTSVFTYYVYVVRQPYATGTFLSETMRDMQYVMIGLTGTILSFGISIILVVVLSVFMNNGSAIVIGTLYALFCTIAPDLKTINYFFPTGYLKVCGNSGFGTALLLIIIVAVIYITTIGFVGNYKIKKIEF